MNEEASQERRWPLKVVIPVAVVVMAVIVALIMWLSGAFNAAPITPTAAPISAEVSETPPSPVPEAIPAAKIAIDQVNPMPYSPVWNPPDEGNQFWQVVDPDMGYPETGGTRYVLAHACESQSCAGDQMLTLVEGDALDFLGETFIVEKKYSVAKNEIIDQPIWEHVPGRLVLITCVIDGAWQDSDHNEILVASPAQ